MKQYESPVPQARKTKDRKPENFFTEGGENERRSHAYQSPSRTFVFNGEDLAERKAQYEASLRHTVVEEAMDRQPSPQESSARARNKASSQARIEAQKEAEKEAEDEFLRSLRSDTNSNGHGGGNNKGGKPGWNDDFTTTSSTGLFGDPKPVPKRNRGTLKASAKVDTGRDSLSRRTKIGSAGVAPVANVGDDMPLPTSIKKTLLTLVLAPNIPRIMIPGSMAGRMTHGTTVQGSQIARRCQCGARVQMGWRATRTRTQSSIFTKE